MPTMNQSTKVVLKSGVKRAIRFDRHRAAAGKKAFAVHVMNGDDEGKVMYFHQVDVSGPSYFVNRPEEQVQSSNDSPVSVYAVTSSALTCYRQPKGRGVRHAAAPAQPAPAAPARRPYSNNPYDC